MSTRLNCPFCGDEAVQVRELDTHIWAVCCDECSTIGPFRRDKDAAERAWNTRLSTPRVPDHPDAEESREARN